jgi:signal transduction histidine kinase
MLSLSLLAILLLAAMLGWGVPGFVRQMPSNLRLTLLSLAQFAVIIFPLLNIGISKGWMHRPFWNWLMLAAVAYFLVLLPWSWRKQRHQFESQAKIRDRSFWPWMYLAGVPILAATLFALYSIRADLNAAEQRAREEAELVAETALARWKYQAEPLFSRFLAAVEKGRKGISFEADFKRSDVLGNPGWIEFSTANLQEPDPVLEADWFSKLSAEKRSEWSSLEQNAASLKSDQDRVEFWTKASRRLVEPELKATGDFALLRAGIAAGRNTNSYDDLLTFRENHSWTSPAGFPTTHLVWRELFRLPVRQGDSTRLSAMFSRDTELEPSLLVPPLLDELERTWAASDTTWKETAARLRSDWPNRIRRKNLAGLIRRTIARTPPPPVTTLLYGGDSFVLLTRESTSGFPIAVRRKSSHLIPLSLWDEALVAVRSPAKPISFRYFDVLFKFGEFSVPMTANRSVPQETQPIAVVPPSDQTASVLVGAEVYLSDRIEFFAKVRRRSAAGFLLALAAAVAALWGVAQARRSYVRQQDLNEAQANFVSSVSHELRAPLASVRLLAENLERGGDESPERRREYYGLMVRECRRLGTLVQNVLDWSRIERGGQQYEFAPADLAALARETARLMEPQFTERNVRLELQIASDAQAPDSLEAVVDAASIQQALINLLDNALKHSPAGSVVSLSLARHGERLQFTVADQGPGIPVEEHERIFDRFHRLGSELRRETAGIGIGLSIVKHIANAHGGSVRVFSALGHGATFTLELPKNR